MEIVLKKRLKLPLIPNFILFETGQGGGEDDQKISIAELNNEQLSQLGESWTKALIQKAEDMRKQPTPRGGI